MIVVLGSASMDLTTYVAVAPALGETVMGREFRTVPGGKGANQAIAAARAGGRVAMIGAVGDDSFGEPVRRTLAESGVDVAGVRTVPGPTGTAHIVVDDSGGNSIVVVPSANATITGTEDGDAERIAAADFLLLQLEAPLSAAIAGAEVARANGTTVVLTPAPTQDLPGALLSNVDVIVPNEHEARALSGVDDLDKTIDWLLERVPVAVVTLGEQGCLYAARGETPVRVPSFAVTAVDTTAAGDTFVGALAVALGEKKPVAEALTWASAAAALAVQRPGASSSMPARAEIEALVEEGQR
ncbi:ribokinase [Allokutzneria sp. NRRL B-24872]|uniref:ribokinase n=1 Tax=Allokutzneria sp. NRRL B-24872 TaxID=1137961 RepID=UPI000A35EA71|nr:ribokinase [Allokutzneria sp. NRRL B-24872]